MTLTAINPRDSKCTTARILLADDDVGIRTLFNSILTSAGFAVIEAADGDEALKLMDQHEFDLALIDLVMPNREGLETIRMARDKHPRLKILAISGAFGGSFLKVAAKMGADSTLTKPVDPEELVSTVTELLAERRHNRN
jgi:DNA-binding response OmpR family regulator